MPCGSFDERDGSAVMGCVCGHAGDLVLDVHVVAYVSTGWLSVGVLCLGPGGHYLV